MSDDARAVSPASGPGAIAVRRWIPVAVLAIALAVIWWSPFDHPLYPHDEGRYAAVAARMVDSGDWIVPVFRGQPHITKPPLTYWLEAVAVTLLGRTEAAARLPAMLATSGVVLAIFCFMRSRRGAMAGILAVGMYSILPLALIVGRIGATDAILNLCWTGGLLSGYLAIDTGRGRWRAAFWTCIAFAAMTKGPLAVGPLGILGTWLLLGGRLREITRLGLGWGLLAPLPLVAWILAVRNAGHDVVGTLWMESFGRANGALGKHEPWWFYLPIFLIGFFPATAMLTLPFFNMSLGRSWTALRSGSLTSLLALAVIIPLIVFSAASGKLPTYLLPVAAPLAMLVAGTLHAWIDGTFDRPIEGFRPPDVRITVAICAGLIAVGFPVATCFAPPLFQWLWLPALVMVLPFAAAVAGALLWSRPLRRPRAIAGVWLALVGAWIVVFHEEDRLWQPRSPELAMEVVQRSAGPNATVVVIGSSDQTRHFYYAGPIRDLGSSPNWKSARAEIERADVVIVDDELWPKLAESLPDVARRLEVVDTKPAFLGGDVRIARVVPATQANR